MKMFLAAEQKAKEAVQQQFQPAFL